MDLLNTNDDLQWLFDTVLNGIHRPQWVKAAVIIGSADAPSKVQLYDKAEPLVRDKPVFTIIWE